MSGRSIECRRYYDGLCDGGTCEDCRFDAVNERRRDKATSLALALLVVGLSVALMVVLL